MLALELDKSTVKAFMAQLLRENVFNSFEVRSVEIETGTRLSIDGRHEQEQAPEAEDIKTGYTTWESLRPLVYAIIKASPKPKCMKIVFSYMANGATEIHSNAAALFLNLTYENDAVYFTTGTAQKEFLFEKSLDTSWDEWVRNFFAQAGLVVGDRE